MALSAERRLSNLLQDRWVPELRWLSLEPAQTRLVEEYGGQDRHNTPGLHAGWEGEDISAPESG